MVAIGRKWSQMAVIGRKSSLLVGNGLNLSQLVANVAKVANIANVTESTEVTDVAKSHKGRKSHKCPKWLKTVLNSRELSHMVAHGRNCFQMAVARWSQISQFARIGRKW